MLLFLFITLLANAAPPSFTDADLRRVKRTPGVLLLSWSPHMNLSVRGLDQALEREKRGGPRVVALLDPACNRSLAERIAREHGWPHEALREVASPELASLGFRLHFPSYVFVGHGALGPVIPGYKTEKELAWFRQLSQR